MAFRKTVASSRMYALCCALVFVVCALAASPYAEVGLNDDWSYIYSAKILASTGHIAYVGWASAMLGWQLPLGVLFIKLLGFSFSATRASMILVSALTAFLLHRVLVRCGATDRNAAVAALTFVLSPVFLPLSVSFMSDVSGIFATIVCLYLCLRSIQADSNRSAFGWLVIASLSNAVGGTARQTAWLGVILMVPATFWLIRRRKPPVLAAILIWLLSLSMIWSSMRWFSHQPYSLREAAVGLYVDRDLVFRAIANASRASVELPLFLLPVLIAFARMFPFRNKRVLGCATLIVIFGVPVALYLHRHFPASEWLAPFEFYGNFVSPRGLAEIPEIGVPPLVLPVWVQGIVTITTLGTTIAFVGFATESLAKKRQGAPRKWTAIDNHVPSWSELFALVGPFTLGYVALLAHRAIFGEVYDRYLLPIFPIAIILLVRFYQETAGTRFSWPSFATLALFTAFSIAGTHDLFAMRRARIAAANELIAAGIPRTSFYGGFEYDGWTQIEVMGFVNSGYMIMPDGFHAEKPIPRFMGTTKPCDDRFAQNVPAIQPRYGLSFDQKSCDGPSRFAPVSYRAWLPPFTRFIYIRTVTRHAF